MATQNPLLSTPARRFHLDAGSREAGRRGLLKARAALAEATAKAAADRKTAVDDDHATAA